MEGMRGEKMTMFPAGVGEKHLNTFLTSALFFEKVSPPAKGTMEKLMLRKNAVM